VLLQSIGIKQAIHVIADPAFYIPKPKQTVRSEGNRNIGITAVPYYHPNYWPTENRKKYLNYVTGMATNLDKLLEGNSQVHLHFFSTKHPEDTAVTKEIVKYMKYVEKCTIYDEDLDQEAILNKINEQDVIIGTRLHSLILALVARKPVIGVSYHHKVSDFMDEINCSNNMIPIDELH